MKESINLPEILYEDKYLLVIDKPAGLIIQGARSSEESLLAILKNFIKERDKKPGNVFLAVVHRLDKMVSGVVLFAKRSKTAKKLCESFQKNEIIKGYLATVEGILNGEGMWIDYLVWDEKRKKALTLKRPLKNAKKAVTFYHSLYTFKNKTYVLLFPLTGRKHQLRVVLSERGYPIIGDIKYGSKERVWGGKAILLHSLYLSFSHPVNKERLEFLAKIPNYFFEDIRSKNKIFKLIKNMHKYLISVKYKMDEKFLEKT